MPDLTFVDFRGPAVPAAWLNDVNHLTYRDLSSGRFLRPSGVARDLSAKLLDTVSVKDNGATGDGVTDDTAAIQDLINTVGAAGGGAVYFPAGTYQISSALTIGYWNVVLKGDGPGSSNIIQTNLSATILDFPNVKFCGIDGLTLDYAANPAVSTAIVLSGPIGGFHFLRNFVLFRSYIGIEVSSVGNFFEAFQLRNYQFMGLYVHDMNDLFLANFLFDAGDSTNGSVGAIRLYDKVEAFTAVNGDVIGGQYGLACDAAVNTFRVRPAAVKFSNVYFDSAVVNDVILNNSIDFDFDNCWFSYAGGSNVSLQTVDGVRFNGGQCINAFQHGMTWSATAKRVIVKGMSIRENGGSTANTYYGLNIAAGCSDFIIQGNVLGGAAVWQSGWVQAVGVGVATGASDRYIIADNLVSGNGTSGVVDNGTGVNKRIANNY